ncbi:unnamed protein product [Discosporangium mesarthrocarpum]
MERLGLEPALQLLWLYERYSIASAGGGVTKCEADHFGRNLGEGEVVGDILSLPQGDLGWFLDQMSRWDPPHRGRVFKAWEAADPVMGARDLLGLMREEDVSG